MIQRSKVSRRDFLQRSLGAAAAWDLQRAAWALGLAPGAPICNTVAAEQEVGPYYVASELLRRNVREAKPGLPLLLKLTILDVRTCQPLQNAAIDIWSCDALGLYAGFTKVSPMGMGPGGPPPGFDPNRPGPPPGFDPQHPENRPGPPEGRPGMGGPPPMHTSDQLTFLRGIQFTDDRGTVEFETLFPGFYMGRTNHIHYKVRGGGRVVSRDAGKTCLEGHTSHTGQVFFPEEVAADLMRQDPYAKYPIHRTTQAEDFVFQDQHGAASIATLHPVDAKRPEAGYIAELVVSVDPTKTPAPVGMRGPGGPRPRA